MSYPFCTFAKLAARDALGRLPERSEHSLHLRAAEEWLKRAHDAGNGDGVSYGYSLRGGWRPSYPETSGYIAETFFDLARAFGEEEWRSRALRICRWLLSIQNRDGSFSNPRYGMEGIVFDTGQDLLGLERAEAESGDVAFREGAERASGWLAGICDGQGRWTSHEHLGVPHVYNTRTAWAPLRARRLSPGAEGERVARANLDWAVGEQRPGGFFGNCSFVPGKAPFTHTIAYTARGLLESGALLGEDRYVDSARRCADAAFALMAGDGFLPGQISVEGEPEAHYCCLTGNCQFAIVWSRLFDLTGDDRYRKAAIRALDYVMERQDIHTQDASVRGAIKGSFPIWGGYAPFSYPNWSTKFFVDALSLRARWP